MLNVTQFKEHVITPALSSLQKYSDDAVELLLFTCAAESNGGSYLTQLKGPALGIYQMEPTTYQDIWANYIYPNGSLLNIMSLNFNAGIIPPPERLIYDLSFATVMTRLHYSRFHEPLPPVSDIDAIWEYYKKYYNTSKGKAKKTESIKKYKEFLKNT